MIGTFRPRGLAADVHYRTLTNEQQSPDTARASGTSSLPSRLRRSPGFSVSFRPVSNDSVSASVPRLTKPSPMSASCHSGSVRRRVWNKSGAPTPTGSRHSNRRLSSGGMSELGHYSLASSPRSSAVIGRRWTQARGTIACAFSTSAQQLRSTTSLLRQALVPGEPARQSQRP